MRIATLLAAAAGIMLASGSALAQDTTKPAGKARAGARARMAERLGLTADQKAKIKEIVKARHQAVKAVLTADQVKQFQDARGQGREARVAARQAVRASLTADQKAKIKEIRQNARQQIKAVLTPEQLAKIKARHQARGQRAAKAAS